MVFRYFLINMKIEFANWKKKKQYTEYTEQTIIQQILMGQEFSKYIEKTSVYDDTVGPGSMVFICLVCSILLGKGQNEGNLLFWYLEWQTWCESDIHVYIFCISCTTINTGRHMYMVNYWTDVSSKIEIYMKSHTFWLLDEYPFIKKKLLKTSIHTVNELLDVLILEDYTSWRCSW